MVIGEDVFMDRLGEGSLLRESKEKKNWKENTGGVRPSAPKGQGRVAGVDPVLLDIQKKRSQIGLPLKGCQGGQGGQVTHLPYLARRQENDEYYTPGEYIEMAREVMGGIDLDPASSEEAQGVVCAERYWTYLDDGLSENKEWLGRVWMNPPYSRRLMMPFVERFCREWVVGNISEGIVLSYNSSDTRWCQMLLGRCSAVCFPKGRIQFYGPGGRTDAGPLKGQMFTYFSRRGTEEFVDVFGELGVCFLGDV